MKETFEVKKSILSEEEIQKFIENREIQAEDFPILEKLGDFPLKFFQNYHNYFNLLKEKSVAQLENDTNHQEDPEQKAFMELLLEFTKKYNWAVSWNLISSFKRAKR